ncbi:MAG TPA: histidine kinase [Dehalococcoidia bacterium]|nr:histidine kinase [Dehalococcoidia bacterium]
MRGGGHHDGHTVRWPFVPTWIHRLTLAQRVRWMFGVGAAVVIIVGLAASIIIRLTTDALSQAVVVVRADQQTVGAMKDALSTENAGVQGFLITGDATYLQKFDSGHANFTAAAAQLAGGQSSAADRDAAAAVSGLENAFRQIAQQEIDLSRAGFPSAAAFHWQTEGQQSEAALRSRLDDVVAAKQQQLQSLLNGANRHELSTRFIFAPIVGFTAAAGILFAFLASRSVSVRIERLDEAIERIEGGDYNVQIAEHRHDELGRLARSIQNMARALETETRERDQLLAERVRANERITALYDVARTVNQSLDPDEVLRLALARLQAHTQMRACVALLRDEETGRFKIVLMEGLGEETAAELSGLMEEEGAQEFAAGVLRRDGLTPIDLDALPIETQPFRLAVAVPLRAKGTDLGVLILATPNASTVSEDEEQLIEGLAKQVGTALEHARLYSQSRQLAVTEERNRLARDLHDSVTQSLFSMSMMAQALPSLIERNAGRAAERATRLSDLARGALAEMRMLILELRPAALREMGLVDALERYVPGFSSREDMEATFCVEGLQRRLPHDQEDALFRVVQEALSNVARHAQASRVSVVLQFEPQTASLAVTDDGVGLPEPLPSGGFGMISMRERLERLGGTLTIEPADDHGCRLFATVPVPTATTSISV